MHSAISWYGGKGRLVHKLLPLLPDHRIYVEIFGGGASLLHAKPPSPVEVYNDIDGGLTNFWRVLRDPVTFEQFHRLVTLTPYSRREFIEAKERWAQETDPVARAHLWFIVARQAFSGDHSNRWANWSYSRAASDGSMARNTLRWLAAIERLPEVHQRWMRVQIESDDFRGVIRRYDSPETVFYADPPYLPDTRKRGSYLHEMTADDHQDLVAMLLAIQGKCILSGYQHPTYVPLEAAGWRRVDWPTQANAAGRTRKTGVLGTGAAMATQARVESVWISPSAQTQMRMHL